MGEISSLTKKIGEFFKQTCFSIWYLDKYDKVIITLEEEKYENMAIVSNSKLIHYLFLALVCYKNRKFMNTSITTHTHKQKTHKENTNVLWNIYSNIL